jgi:hypothetical protein
MKTPTIYEIKRLVERQAIIDGKQSYYFSKDTMKFFKQTLRDFKVMRHPTEKGKFLTIGQKGNGFKSFAIFDPQTNKINPCNDPNEWKQ